jgi:hypothetical protein
MHRTRRVLLGGIVLCLALTCLTVAAPPPAATDSVADPVPIRRVLLPADRVAAELEKRQGVLVQLSREDFEAKVARAALAMEAAKDAPHLVEARYRATLNGNALVGSAEWKIVNPMATAAILPVQPLGVALRQARWSDNRAARLAFLDGKDLGLLVDANAQSSVLLDWSARSTPVNGGLRFSLELPPCAVSTLELDLPAEYMVTHENGQLSGPRIVGDRRAWRVSFAGQRVPVGLTIRRQVGPDLPAPLVLSRLDAKQDLSPGQIQADYDFNLEVLHAGIRELRLECASNLRPFEVNAGNLEGWELKPGQGNNPSALRVRFREPFQGGKLKVRCLAALPSDQGWTSPEVRLLDAVPREETLTVRVAADLQLDDWQPGGYRLSKSFEQDEWQVIQLSAGLEAGDRPTRPSARVQTPKAEYQARQLSWWQVGPTPILTSQIYYEVTRGRLFRLSVQVPAGWTVDQVETTPPELLRQWGMGPDSKKPTLQVELERALGPATSARLTIRARPTKPGPPPLEQPFPDLVPDGARAREGGLGISVGSLYQARVATPLLITLPPEAPDAGGTKEPEGSFNSAPLETWARGRGPWGKVPPDYYVVFGRPAADGTLHLRSRQPQLRASCSTDVFVHAGRVTALARLDLSPSIGSPRSLDIFISGPGRGPWRWQTIRGTNAVSEAVPLPAAGVAPALGLLGAHSTTDLLALAPSMPPVGSWYRLTLERPLQGPLNLEATVEVPDEGLDLTAPGWLALLGSSGPLQSTSLAAALPAPRSPDKRPGRWVVPLVSVPGVEGFLGRATLHLSSADLVRLESEGLHEGAVPGDDARAGRTGDHPTSPWRSFHYGPPPVALELHGKTTEPGRAADALIESASLRSHLQPGNHLLHTLRLRVRGWAGTEFTVKLPAGTHLLKARVDGRWIGQSDAAADNKTTCRLPLRSSTELQEVEVWYAEDLPAWSLWSVVRSPLPILPAPVVNLSRSWRLPPGVAPLDEQGLVLAPGKGGTEWFNAAPSETIDALDSRLDGILNHYAKVPDEPILLGPFLEKLAFEQPIEPLVVDAEALRTVCLHCRSPLPKTGERGPAAWSALGLAVFPSRGGPLLTTAAQAASWRQENSAVPVPASVHEAVAEALHSGHDRSGRFRTVLDWLQTDSPGAGPVEPADEGTVWQVTAGASMNGLVIVRPGAVQVAALVVGALLTLVVVAPWARKPWGWGWSLAWFAVAGVSWLWFPGVLRPLALGPLLAGAIFGIIQITCRLHAVAPAPTAPVIPVARLVGCLLLALTAITGRAAAPAPDIVYIIADPNRADKQLVLAPNTLLDQLDTLSRRGVENLRTPVLHGATYEGKVDGRTVNFEARFDIHAFADEPAALTVPLGGVQVAEALLDGAPANPVALKTGKEGFTLDIRGRGSHSLVVRFTVPLPGGDEREFRINVPELPRSRLTLEVPAPAGHLHAVDAHGAQRVTVQNQVARLEADLGAVGLVRVRWRKDENPPPGRTLSLREAYYWELQPSSARLLAVLQYTVTVGWEMNLNIDLPPELEVQSVEAGPVPGSKTTPPKLKEWRLRTEGNRHLVLEFQEPITDSVQVTLELVPRRPTDRNFSLPFPNPQDVQWVSGFLACRIIGLDATIVDHRGIVDMPNKSFATEFAEPWAAARRDAPPVPTYTFSRKRGGSLKLNLQAPASSARSTQDVSWWVGLQQAELRATVKVAAADASLSFVEVEVPGGTFVNDVTGPQLRRWARFGTRVQAWLQKPVAETTLQIQGGMTRQPMAVSRFDVQPLRILDAPGQGGSVRVAAADGVSLAPGTPKNLTLRPDQGTPGREWAYQIGQEPSYGVGFLCTREVAEGTFRLLTVAEPKGREVVFTTDLHCDLTQGDLSSLELLVANWPGGDLVVRGEGVARRQDRQTAPDARAILLDLKPGQRSVHLLLTGSLPLEGASQFVFPDIRVEAPGMNPDKVSRWVGVAGSELVSLGAIGLVLETSSDALRPWKSRVDRIAQGSGAVWRIVADDWRLRLRQRTAGTPAAPVRLYLTEHAVGLADRERWLHQTTFWLAHEAGTDLTVLLPSGASVLGLTVDGVAAPVSPATAERLWLPLSGRSGSRVVRLLWAYPPGREPLETPWLLGPRLEGVSAGPTTWALAVPPDMAPAGRIATLEGRPHRASAAALELNRAAAQLGLSTFLVERARYRGDKAPLDQLRDLRQQFEQSCRLASDALEVSHGQVLTGPDGQDLHTWLKQLRDQYAELMREPDAAPLWPKPTRNGSPIATARPLLLVPTELGVPTNWQSPQGAVPPSVHLTYETTHRSYDALGRTALLFLALAISGLFAKWGPRTWPEQLLLLTALSPLLFGSLFLWALVPAAVVWLIVRLGGLFRWLRTRFTPPPPLAEIVS